MKPGKIRENIYWVGAVDWDRRLFDSLIPLPDGTSYNAYLIRGSEKTVLLDSVDPAMTDVLMSRLEEIQKIDYIISHHAEQDHSGSIPAVMEKYGDAKVITSPKGKGMLFDLLAIPEEKFITVEDGETLSLGDKTLKFIYTPWVHWPETMSGYLVEDKILFSCDFFGSHIATTDLFATDEMRVCEAAKRYYAETMMPFRSVIQKNLEKLKSYEIEMIAPSHGPVYHKPGCIMNSYHSWVSGKPENLVVLPYISMHGSTKKMVDYLVGALSERGVSVQQFDLTVTDTGKLAMALVDAGTIVIGTPTVMAQAHPKAVYAAYLAGILKPKVKFASIIGSYGWGGKVVEQISGLIKNLKVELLEPVLCKGLPGDAQFMLLDKMAEIITEKHKEHNLS